MTYQTDELGEFFDYFWGEQQGYVYLPVQSPPYGKDDWHGFMYPWPRKRKNVIEHVLKHTALEANVFFAPTVFRKASPKKDAVLGTNVLWVDFDGTAPDEWPYREVPKPTLIVQSSNPGHEHCYWRLDEFLTDIPTIEDRNRAIAYVLGADTSGWDADQVLRPIHSFNYKRGVAVELKEWSR